MGGSAGAAPAAAFGDPLRGPTLMERVVAKWWLGVALTVGGLAVAAPAPAQYLPPGGPGAPGYAAAGNLPPAPAPAGPYSGPAAGPYGGPYGGPPAGPYGVAPFAPPAPP